MPALTLGRFINARRRILQPMLDASNPDPAPKAKKIKSQHRPTQRFWPNSIAAGVLQQQGGAPGTSPDGKAWAEWAPAWGLVGGRPLEVLQDSCAKIRGLNLYLLDRQGAPCHNSCPSLVPTKECV